MRLTGIASLCAVVGYTLLCTTQMSRAQKRVKPATIKRPPPRSAAAGSSTTLASVSNPLRLGKPLRDANGNLLRHSGRPVEISASSVIVYPTSIDVMQMFIPWEFRVTGMFER